MKNLNILISLVLCFLILNGCTDSEIKNKGRKKELSASVTASISRDGTIKTSTPTTDEKNSIEDFHKKVRKVDSEYPGVNPPSINDLHKVNSILEDGTIALEDGTLIRLAGCDCGEKAKHYLKRTFIDNNYQLLYIPSGYTNNRQLYSYVWEIELGTGEGVNKEGIPIGTSMSRVNEVMILNKWCVPIEQPFHNYFDRYLAYSKIIE